VAYADDVAIIFNGKYPQTLCDLMTAKLTKKNAIVEDLDYQIPITQLMGPKRNGDMQAAKRD